MNKEDLIITVYPPRGGGMQTGKPPVGIKIEHKPTGITVICDKFRNQYKNKATALEQLSIIIGKGSA